MHVVPCICDVVHTLWRWCGVYVVLCTCTYGTGVRVGLCACHICCVEGTPYYVCALCSCGIATCVHAHGLGEVTRCLSGVETEQECVRNKDKGRS